MNKIVAVTFCLTFSLSMPIAVNAGAAPPALASAAWSVNGAYNLASNPPSLAAVQAFEHRAFGVTDESGPDKVCEFRFADFRHSGNLSLIVTADGGGTGGCNLLYIFDKTPTGFELYSADGAVGDDLAKSVIDHEGKNGLVLWGYLAGVATNELECEADWPLVFAWTGNGYAEAGSQYKRYYEEYLSSLNKQIAAGSSAAEEAQWKAAGQTPAPQPLGDGDSTPVAPGLTEQSVIAAPAASRAAAAASEPDYDCLTLEAAKTESFLGIHSDATMRAAIKDYESNDPYQRILAAVIFSYIGTQEAGADLKTLANDSDSRVAKIAKDRSSFGEDPIQDFRTISRQPVFGEYPAPYYLKLQEQRHATP